MTRKHVSDISNCIHLCWHETSSTIEGCLCNKDCEPFAVGSGNYGYIKAVRLRDQNAWYVQDVGADSGWGPLLYDFAMQYATDASDGLISDRHHVTIDAVAVWRMYRSQRNDVTHLPAPAEMERYSISEESNDPDAPDDNRDPTEDELQILNRIYKISTKPLDLIKHMGRVISCRCQNVAWQT